nr:glycerophosphodiester phosphodiesterase family protein [Clostridium algifaecis]
MSHIVINQRYNSINSSKPIIVAHRGASSIDPENSIPSSDGILYLLHDGTLDRTTNGHGLITSKSSHIVDSLIINNGSNISTYPNLRLPRFENALIECKKDKLTPIFDIKFLSSKDRNLNTFLRIIRKHGYERKLLVHSFNYKDLEYLRSKDKKLS